MLGNKKFYKLYGLNNIFKYSNHGTNEDPMYVYNTSVNGFNDSYILKRYGVTGIDMHTILFITACASDEGRYVNVTSKELVYFSDNDISENEKTFRVIIHEGDTMIWSRGDLYSVSTLKHVNSVSLDENNNIVIENSDGTNNIISPTDSKLGYSGIYPIVIEDNEIKLKGLSLDEDNNLIVNTDSNSVFYNVKNSNTFGVGNQSIVNNQTIFGKFAKPDSNAIFIIGGGNDNTSRINLFSVSFDGIVYAQNDVITGKDKEYRLSDIHSVLDSDWAFIDTKITYDSFDDSFDASYNDNSSNEDKEETDDYDASFDESFDD
jgi:hypothetical protein